MIHIRTLVLTLVSAASLAGAGYAATMSGGSAADRVRPFLGTWSCKQSGNNHTATFTPIWGGSGMRISETGTPASEETIVFDPKRGKWIDQYFDNSRMYATLVGTPIGKTVHFVQVYPPGKLTILVTLASKNVYTTSSAAVMNGKTMMQREVCTRM